MVENAQATYEAVCPHCKRDFVAELMEGSSEHLRGFKCPHCKLFVPFERAEEPVESDS